MGPAETLDKEFMASLNKSAVPGPGITIAGDQNVVYREAIGNDVEAIAALHADSWRRHYRGAFLDSFLDGDVLPERIAVWRARLSQTQPADITVVAELRSAVVGFLHMIVDEDPEWGTLLDNLHVVWHLKHQGIGRSLIRQGAEKLLQRGRRNFHLWVLDQNVAAQRFYLSQGGIRVETCMRGPFPGGGHALGHRMAWTDASVLAALKCPEA
jgi:ribosomal protein S18 acetylase RimI-like enzyme